jgi:predicted peroxiredoxin
MIRFIVAAVVLQAGVCVAATTGNVEKLLGVTASKAGLTFAVASGGCTDKDSFVLTSSEGNVLLVRTRIDRCEAMPHVKQVHYTNDDLKTVGVENGKTVLVGNPVMVGTPMNVMD